MWSIPAWLPRLSHQRVKSACPRSPALFGGEADVARFGSFVGAGLHEAGGVEVSADGGDGHVEAVVVL